MPDSTSRSPECTTRCVYFERTAAGGWTYESTYDDTVGTYTPIHMTPPERVQLALALLGPGAMALAPGSALVMVWPPGVGAHLVQTIAEQVGAFPVPVVVLPPRWQGHEVSAAAREDAYREGAAAMRESAARLVEAPPYADRDLAAALRALTAEGDR